jgi:predicted permease
MNSALFARVRSFIAATFNRGRFEDGMREELRFHMDAYADDLSRSGVPPEEARRRARLEFGAMESIKEDCRQNRGLRLLDEVRQDLRYALRTLVKTPVFTGAAILSLALGIGANTAIFSLMDAVLLRTLPLHEPERLYFLAHDPGPNISTSSNYPLFERYKTVTSFSGLTAYRPRTFKVTISDGIERVSGLFASGNYHAVVGARMLMGRGFSADTDWQRGVSPVAVISYDYWRNALGADSEVLGKPLIVDGRTVSIGGVTAPGFSGLNPGERADIMLPISVLALDSPGFLTDHDGWFGLFIVGRLAPNVGEQDALAAVNVIFQQFHAAAENQWARNLNRDSYRSAALVPAAKGMWSLRRTYGKPLRISMAMVAVVLLIACANIANLLFARASARAREMAVRLSIGAGRGRLVRQLLTESLVLALCGGAAGAVLAIWGTQTILSLLTAGPTPVFIEAGINARVLGFTATVVLMTAIGFGLVPAFRSTRVDLTPTLKAGVQPLRDGQRPTLGTALVAVQFALCVLVVGAAGLLSRSLSNLHGLDAGFKRDNILLAEIDISAAKLQKADRLGVYAEILDRLRTAPGVVSAAISARTPIDFSAQQRRIDVPGVPAVPGQGVSTNLVTPDYFQIFGIDLVRGRPMTADDPSSVALVSQSMAKFHFGESDPIGRTFRLGGDKQTTTVIGLVKDARHERLRGDVPPKMVYTHLAVGSARFDASSAGPDGVTVALLTEVDPSTLAPTIRREIRSLRKDALVPYVRTMEQQIDHALVPERLLTSLSTWLGGVALILACVGLYGVMAYNVSRRTREIGIRIALGAVPRTVLVHILRETVVMLTIGVVLGLTAALAATRTLSTFLFGLTPHDPATLLSTTALLFTAAMLAGFMPARYAAAVDPVKTLKNE